jgi:biopolymer transport protein ExbB
MTLWLNLATILEYGILLLLFGLSIWSFTIMIDRKRAFAGEVKKEELSEVHALVKNHDQGALQKWASSHPGLHAGVLNTAAQFKGPGRTEAVDRSVRAYLMTERARYEKGLAILATLGANAPFIGLFGTVLGIVRAFAALGDNSGAAASVMSGISLALIATAAGLFVAIPAVVAFNTFSNRWKSLVSECEVLKDLLVAHEARDGR